MKAKMLLLVCITLFADWPNVLSQPEIRGLILDYETELPIIDARALLVHVNDPDSPMPGANAPVVVPVDSTGHFFFAPDLINLVRSKEILLFAQAKNYGFSAVRLQRHNLSIDKTFRLQALIPLTGVVKTEEGVPIAGAVVGIVYEDTMLRGLGASPGALYQGAYSDGKGVFTTKVAVGYGFVVEAFHPEFLPAFSALGKLSTSEDTTAVVVPIHLRLGKGLVVRGRVVDDAGKGLGGVSVRLTSKSLRIPYEQSRAFPKKLYQHVATAADGSFVFEGVMLGEKELIVADARGVPLERQPLTVFKDVADLLITAQ